MDFYAIVEVDEYGVHLCDMDPSFDTQHEAEAAAKKKPKTKGGTWIVLACREVWSRPENEPNGGN